MQGMNLKFSAPKIKKRKEKKKGWRLKSMIKREIGGVRERGRERREKEAARGERKVLKSMRVKVNRYAWILK